jgi:hypothetical protein
MYRHDGSRALAQNLSGEEFIEVSLSNARYRSRKNAAAWPVRRKAAAIRVSIERLPLARAYGEGTVTFTVAALLVVVSPLPSVTTALNWKVEGADT